MSAREFVCVCVCEAWYNLADSHKSGMSFWDIMVKMLDCSLEVSEFEFQLRYYVDFQPYTFGKDMNSLIPLPMG